MDDLSTNEVWEPRTQQLLDRLVANGAFVFASPKDEAEVMADEPPARLPENESYEPSEPEGFREFAKAFTELEKSDLKELVDGPPPQSPFG